MINPPKIALGSLALLLCLASAAAAADFEVRLLNNGAGGKMVFEPASLSIQPGDSVTFVPVDKGHNVETIKGMIPEGVATFKSSPSQPFTVTFDVAGAYGIKCTPHFGMGMVALIVVGADLPNLDAARAVTLPPKAQERMDAAFGPLGL